MNPKALLLIVVVAGICLSICLVAALNSYDTEKKRTVQCEIYLDTCKSECNIKVNELVDALAKAKKERDEFETKYLQLSVTKTLEIKN